MVTVINISMERPVIATPKALPAAGGCPMSNIVVMNIVAPTASEYIITE